MSKQACKELLWTLIPKYQAASRVEKQLLLTQFVDSTGYARKYAITLLSASNQHSVPLGRRRGRREKLQEEAKDALFLIWRVCGQICGKRLVSAIPAVLANLQAHGRIAISEVANEQLLTISAATIDRVLKAERAKSARSLSLTRKGNLVKNKVPIRTFSEWNDVVPGFFEIDTVAHCSFDPGGRFLYTLNMTDIATCWTVPVPLVRKTSAEVVSALTTVAAELPFPLLGLDSDNGSEFLNEELLSWCEQRQITYTRSREYKKNDQAWIEEKNRSVVRNAVGKARYEGDEAFETLSELYKVLTQYFNFFVPCQKLVSKTRVGSKTIKRYDHAKTPYQRTIESVHVSEELKHELSSQYERLDVFELEKRLRLLQARMSELEIDLLQPVEAVLKAQRTAAHRFVAAMRSAEPQQRKPDSKSLPSKIMEIVGSLKAGTTFRADRFAGLGTDQQVKQALSRLAARGLLDRVAHGVYAVKTALKAEQSKSMHLVRFLECVGTGEEFQKESIARYASRRTIARHLNKLIQSGAIERLGNGRYRKAERYPEKRSHG